MAKLAIARTSLDDKAQTATVTFANKEVRVLEPKSFPKNIQTMFTLNGMAKKVTGAYTGTKSVDAAVEAFDTGVELLQGGEWLKRRSGGTARPSMVVAAVIAALEADGQTVDDERRQSITEKCAGSEGRKRVLDNPVFAAQYEQIKAEAAAERALKAQEKAAAETEVDLSSF